MPITTTPAAIFKKLHQIAPAIVFNVAHTLDPHFRWDGDGPDPREDGYEAYDVDVTARAVVDGKMREGRNSLGGTYDRPGKYDPDIGGYLPQMLEEAVDELRNSGRLPAPLAKQAESARKYLKDVMRVRYDEQRRQHRSGDVRTRKAGRSSRGSKRSSRRPKRSSRRR